AGLDRVALALPHELIPAGSTALPFSPPDPRPRAPRPAGAVGPPRARSAPLEDPSVTQMQLDAAVANATGESLGLVRGLGFSLASLEGDDLEPEDLVLAVLCPFCRSAIAYPGPTHDGAVPLAECPSCDVYFEITPDEISTKPSEG